jgi:hypothetical protein
MHTQRATVAAQQQQQQHGKQPSWLMPWQTGDRNAGETLTTPAYSAVALVVLSTTPCHAY